jgi:predicted DCC family thiol-disulfide oxidoreductase YuxK
VSGPEATPGDYTVIYDGDCGVCKTLLALLLRVDRHCRLTPLALGTPAADALLDDLTPEQRNASWHLIDSDGQRESAGAAVPPLLALLPGGPVPSHVLARFPSQTERAYRAVADNRSAIGRWIPSGVKRRATAAVGRRTAA